LVMIPPGFPRLVEMTMNERPQRPKNDAEIWDKFLFIVFMGGKRSEPDINFLLRILKPFTPLEYVLKTDGDDWREVVEKAVDERLSRIRDEDAQIMLREFKKELFRITASIKGSARFFQSNSINIKTLENLLTTKDKTWEFIEELASNEDVSNIRFTKVIIWLQSIGFAQDVVAPSWQTKNFVNEVFGYYQFYDDEKYFMKKAEEFAEEVRKAVPKATTRDVASAIFYYTSVKGMLPLRSPEKKKFSAALLVGYLKSRNMTLRNISEKLADYEGREEFMEGFYSFLRGRHEGSVKETEKVKAKASAVVKPKKHTENVKQKPKKSKKKPIKGKKHRK
jgi:uncharacterized membrane protein